MMLAAVMETARNRASWGPARRRSAYLALEALAAKALRTDGTARTPLEAEAQETFKRLDSSCIEEWTEAT